MYANTHHTSATAQKKSSAQRIHGTRARKVEGTMSHLRTSKGPEAPCFLSFPGKGLWRGAWTQHGGGHGAVRTAKMHWGVGTSTVVWRKWKLLCICLRDPRIAHGCWYATGGHHAGGHAQALPSHHQRPLLHLLLLLLHLPLPQVLAQDLPLPLRQHLRVDRALCWHSRSQREIHIGDTADLIYQWLPILKKKTPPQHQNQKFLERKQEKGNFIYRGIYIYFPIS